MKAFALNLLVSVVWLLLQPGSSGVTLLIGFAFGFALIALFRELLDASNYVRRMFAAMRFCGVFLREFLLSSWQLTSLVISRRLERLQPTMLRYDITGLTRMEALLLSHCISLTPGTTTVDIDPDFRSFILHVIDGRPEQVRKSIDETLRAGILAFTR
ncbi:MAG: Na+/H+ antiporter subunit E [Opitutaceae bacterium]|jgi:multicomponent Na+:H+ antiporter subunit E|nr:Na+/H+ antiporter subunit E [Opitutaceae bacterium]